MEKKAVKSRGKKLVTITAASMFAIMLTGCASNADTLMSPGPNKNSTSMPGKELVEDAKEMLPGSSPNARNTPDSKISVANNGLSTLNEIRKASEQMAEAVDMLSEVDDAVVIAIGNQALVGIEFDDQYQGTLNERMHKMILARIQTINRSVNEIYATTQPETYNAIELLSEKLEDAKSLDSVTRSFSDIIKELSPFIS